MTASQAEIDALAATPPPGEPDTSAPDSPPTEKPQSPQPESPGSGSTASDTRPKTDNVERILHLSVPVAATLAEREMPIETILSLTVGSIIEFDVPFDSDLILSVSNRPIGRGQAVKVGEHFGLRITAIDTVRERIDAMRGR